MENRKNDGSCVCEKGYYEQLFSPKNKCVKCKDRYAACTAENSPTECNGANRKSHTLDCVCQDKHYKDPNSMDCLPCKYPCDDCESETVCKSKKLPLN